MADTKAGGTDAAEAGGTDAAEALDELLNGLGSIAHEAETLAKAVNDRAFPLSELTVVRLADRLAATAAICHESVYQVKLARREGVSG